MHEHIHTCYGAKYIINIRPAKTPLNQSIFFFFKGKNQKYEIKNPKQTERLVCLEKDNVLSEEGIV